MIDMKEILSMSVEERIFLIEKIWDSIPENNNIEYELEKRLQRYSKGETTFVSWDDIRLELKNRRQKTECK